MKKLSLLFTLFILSTGSLYAWLDDWPFWSEEDACFNLLNEAISNDIRFQNPDLMPNGDLSNVLYDESNNSYYDFSSYSNFWNVAVPNPVNAWGPGWDDYLFEARRNNIWTIISWNNFVYSQISWFWRDSNFDFPLESKSWAPFWDKYRMNGNFFKEYVIFTHHLKSFSESYPLMSCGIAKVTPLWGKTFSDINESGYMTNILNGIAPQQELGWSKCASWFEWEYDSESGDDFYKMKANVCVQSYDETDYLKLELISVAFDNDSQRLNEYYTHPLQVEAMRNNANHAQWLKWIQDVFRSKLENQTCYSVIHWSRNNLPERCDNEFWPISFQTSGFSIKDFFIPSAYAQRSQTINLPEMSPEEEQDTWMMVYGNLPYSLYKKLESIPDESFREYMLLSILPNFEELILHREENDVLLTPFEEVFQSCDLNYEERLTIVKDFLTELDVDNFSLSQLDYSNEKYGDCVIPYPDKDKLDIVVEWSFDSNRLLAEKLSWVYIPESDSPEVAEYIRKREEILAELNKELALIDTSFNTGEIDINRASVLKIEQQEQAENKIQQLDISLENENALDEIIKETVSEQEEENNNYLTIGVIVLLVFLGSVLIILAFYKKNKKN